MGFCMSKVIKKMYARRQCLELRIITHYLRSKNDLRHRNICKKFVHDGAKIGISLISRWNLHAAYVFTDNIHSGILQVGTYICSAQSRFCA